MSISELKARIPSREEAQKIKLAFPAGLRLETEESDRLRKGAVSFVDALGTVFINGDDGSVYGIIPAKTKIKTIEGGIV